MIGSDGSSPLTVDDVMPQGGTGDEIEFNIGELSGQGGRRATRLMEEVPDYITTRYNAWKAKRDKWLKYAQECKEYYYNDVEGTKTTYTQKQKSAIEKKSGIPVTINYLYPTANQDIALLIQTKPSHKTVSMDGRFKERCEVIDKMSYHIMYSSNAVLENEEATKDTVIMGLGHVMIDEKGFFEPGEFGFTYRRADPAEIILDAGSRRRDNQDMLGYFVDRMISYIDFCATYKPMVDELRDKKGRPISLEYFRSSKFMGARKDPKGTYDVNNPDVWVREYYDKIFTTMYLVQDETGKFMKLFRENMVPGTEWILESAKDKVQGIFIRKWTIAGDKVIGRKTMPLTYYNCITNYFEWAGHPYDCYGMVHFSKAMQDALDKSIQLMLINGQLQNNAGYKTPKGGIAPQDRDNWQIYANDPTKIKEYVPQVYAGKVFIPERETIQSLSNFYPMITEMMKQGIYDVTGIRPVLSGDTSEAKVDVFSSLRQYQDAAMQRVIMAVTHINQSQVMVGNVMIQYLGSMINPGDYYAFFNEKGVLNEMEIALDMAQDLTLGRFKMLSVPGQLMPSQRTATSSELYKIAQSSADPYERQVYTQTALEMADIPGTGELQQKLDTVKQLSGQVQSLQEQIKRQEEIIKQLENRTLNSELKARLMEMVVSSTEELQMKKGRLNEMVDGEMKKELDKQKLASQQMQGMGAEG